MTVEVSKGAVFAVTQGGTPVFVKSIARARTNGIGATEISVGIRSGANLRVDGPFSPTSAFSGFTKLMSSDPITGGAWSASAVDALEWAVVAGGPPSASVFRVLFATPINSNTIRVFFSGEPRHQSPIGSDDALNRLNWQVTLQAGPTGAKIPVVEGVENAQPRPDIDATFPNAWSVDLRLDRRILAKATYVTIASTAIRSVAGVNLFPDPDDRDDHPGIHVPRSGPDLQPPAVRTGIDFRYDFFDGRFRFDPKGDLDIHAGADSLKKRIIRRMITAPGGFFHLPGYGVGLRSKELLRTTNLAQLRSQILNQVREEADAEQVRVDVSRSQGVLFVTIAATVRNQAIRLSVEVPPEGEILVS